MASRSCSFRPRSVAAARRTPCWRLSRRQWQGRRQEDARHPRAFGQGEDQGAGPRQCRGARWQLAGPAEPREHGRITAKTLWGELAWQLGKEDGATRWWLPGSRRNLAGQDVLATLLTKYGPAVVLLDETVAYLRQFEAGRSYPGGTYNPICRFCKRSPKPPRACRMRWCWPRCPRARWKPVITWGSRP